MMTVANIFSVSTLFIIVEMAGVGSSHLLARLRLQSKSMAHRTGVTIVVRGGQCVVTMYTHRYNEGEDL